MVLIRLGLLIFVFSSFSFASDLSIYEEESKISIKELAFNLKKSLKAVIQESGPIAAIEYCNIAALDITDGISQKKNIFIKRTSLKLRNKNNMPDSWEINVLNSFEKRKKNGEGLMYISHQEIYEENNKTFYRYMKVIPTGKVCLTCHGSNIKPELISTIIDLYPEDKAYNFKVGDIRGAFSVKIPLSN
jgi:hypothetical protein